VLILDRAVQVLEPANWSWITVTHDDGLNSRISKWRGCMPWQAIQHHEASKENWLGIVFAEAAGGGPWSMMHEEEK
jgi:hypothetical protein